jgi:hypothetical protein
MAMYMWRKDVRKFVFFLSLDIKSTIYKATHISEYTSNSPNIVIDIQKYLAIDSV